MIRRREYSTDHDLPYINGLYVRENQRHFGRETIRFRRHSSRSPTNRARFKRHVQTITNSSKVRGRRSYVSIRSWMIRFTILVLFSLVFLYMNLIMDEINMKYFHPRQTEEERYEYPIMDQATMNAMKWYEVERKLVAETLQKRRTARIDRTKPPIHDTSIIEELRRTNRYASRVDNEEYTNMEEAVHHQKDQEKNKFNQAKSDHCGYHAKDAFKSNPSFYPLKHMINHDSVIVITGILGRIGFHLALKLASCNVKVIIAIDGMYPNDPPYRLRQLQQLAHLYAKVPSLNKPFIMTYDGINPKVTYHSSFQQMMNDLNGELDFSVFQPTHIVHLTNAEMNNSESHDTDGIFHLRQSLIGLEQLLASFSQVKSDLQFILASSTAGVHGDDEEYIINDDVLSKKKIFQATKEMEETMLKLFAKTYSRTFLILRLPTVYGPWGKLGDSDYDMVSVATTHWGRKGMTKQILDDNMYLLHVDDVIDVIISAMQFKHSVSDFVVLNLQPVTKVSSSAILNFIESCMPPNTCSDLDDEIKLKESNVISELGWAPKVPLSKGLMHLIAWHLDRIHFDNANLNGISFARSESGSSFLQRNNETICDAFNVYCLRGKQVLPCASECADPLLCLSSPFDEVIQESKRLTEGCEFVIYTSQFSKSAKKIQINAPGGGGECNIAFVSKSSEIAKSVENSRSKSSRLVSNNGWTLIAIDIENDTMNGNLKSLLKLSPGLFMHIRVEKALFLSDDSHMNLVAEDIPFIKSFMSTLQGVDRDLLISEMNQLNYLKIDEDSDALMVLPSIRKESIDTQAIYDGSSGITFKKYSFADVAPSLLDENPRRSKQASRHIAFYNIARSIFNECDFAVDCKERFKIDPHHWIRMTWIAHNFKKDNARKFRCEWYGEQTQWLDTNEALSFAYVMARLQVERYYSLDDEDKKKHTMLTMNNDKEYDISTDRYQWHSVLDNQLIRTIDIRAMKIERSLWSTLRERKKKLKAVEDALGN